MNLDYPELPDLDKYSELIKCYSRLKYEYGAENIEIILEKIENCLEIGIKNLKELPEDRKLAQKEPNQLEKIKKLRPEGPRKLDGELEAKEYRNRLKGALLGRFAGCTLGAPVEFWSMDRMKRLARENNMDFPPRDYWTYVPDPYKKRYEVSERELYTRDKLDGVPVDDDITYTILGLLIVEDYGVNFSIEEVGQAWLDYLPYACTAEKVALKNLKKGVDPLQAGEKDNPYREWIGADIRSDPWGYMAPGHPEKAAEMAYKDAYISHRRQGIYGEMFFAAVIAAALVVDNPIEAVEIGLTEIPEHCALAEAIQWALDKSSDVNNYREARKIVEDKFAGMDRVHTINNACLTIFGLTIGGKDFTKVIGETVAMGKDNDCTAATAGSITGALLGEKDLPSYWYKNFNNKVYTYLKGEEEFEINDLVDRFYHQSQQVK